MAQHFHPASDQSIHQREAAFEDSLLDSYEKQVEEKEKMRKEWEEEERKREMAADDDAVSLAPDDHLESWEWEWLFQQLEEEEHAMSEEIKKKHSALIHHMPPKRVDVEAIKRRNREIEEEARMKGEERLKFHLEKQEEVAKRKEKYMEDVVDWTTERVESRLRAIGEAKAKIEQRGILKRHATLLEVQNKLADSHIRKEEIDEGKAENAKRSYHDGWDGRKALVEAHDLAWRYKTAENLKLKTMIAAKEKERHLEERAQGAKHSHELLAFVQQNKVKHDLVRQKTMSDIWRKKEEEVLAAELHRRQLLEEKSASADSFKDKNLHDREKKQWK